jgi:hypothetical protein
MKHFIYYILAGVFTLLTGCLSDKHEAAVYPQKIFETVNTKYPSDKNTLIFIGAPEGFTAPRLATSAVENGVDNGKVVAIISALALKTTTVVIAGENESITATTLAKALTTGKDKISGAKAIIIGAKDTQKNLTDLAATSGVALEFIDNPI